MLKVLLPSIIGALGVVIAVILSFLLYRTKTRIEILKARLEIDKMRVEMEKAIAERDRLLDQQLRTLTDEFWQKVASRATETGRERGTWLATKQAFLHFLDANLVASESLLVQADQVIARLSRKYVGKTLSNQELLRAIAELETWESRLEVEEHAIYTKERSFDDLPYEERDRHRRPLEVEQESLRSVHHRLHALRADIVRESWGCPLG
jgi:hypothetical protein